MNRTYSRRAMVAAGLATLAGCLGGSEGGEDTTTATSTTGTTTTPSTSTETFTETTTDYTDVDLPLAGNPPPVADSAQTLRDSVSRGAGKDSIPSIDEPTFVSPGEAELAEDDVVFGIAMEETVKAYPQPILLIAFGIQASGILLLALEIALPVGIGLLLGTLLYVGTLSAPPQPAR